MQVTNEKQNVTLNLKIISVVLLVVIAVMLAIWKPWVNEPLNSDRVISVRGQTTLKAEPDEFVFSPTYVIRDKDREVALQNLSKKSSEILDGLKKIGIEEKNIKTNAADYSSGFYWSTRPETNSYNLSIMVTVNQKELVQKVQDYLLTTEPSGVITPQASFSEAKQKQLESEAKNQAEKDARSKAEESAKNLGFKVGKVKSVSVSNLSVGPIPIYGVAEDSSSSSRKLAVQPGQNDFYYAVEVVYYIR